MFKHILKAFVKDICSIYLFQGKIDTLTYCKHSVIWLASLEIILFTLLGYNFHLSHVHPSHTKSEVTIKIMRESLLIKKKFLQTTPNGLIFKLTHRTTNWTGFAYLKSFQNYRNLQCIFPLIFKLLIYCQIILNDVCFLEMEILQI